MLTLSGVKITQGDFRLEASIGFQPGQVIALIGPSGAGKSTLMSVLSGFFDASAGEVLWDGKRIDHLPPDRRPVSMLFQDNNLFPHLTVEQNVGLALRPSLRFNSEEKRKITSALERVGLHGKGDRRPAELSGGQQSRAALARLLLQNKPIVLLDEPFAALGPGLKREMLCLVRDSVLTSSGVVIMVTHDPEDARFAADQIALVDEGFVHHPQPTADVLNAPPEVLRRYMGTQS